MNLHMEKIPLEQIYQHNLNFLIGAGASSGLFPTLWLSLKNSDDLSKEETIETLANKLDTGKRPHHYTLLFMYYYKKIIEPVCNLRLDQVCGIHSLVGEMDDDCPRCKKRKLQQEVINNYEVFIDSVVRVLQQKNGFSRRCNLFTTNYDGCIPLVADKLLKKGALTFRVNDGTSGFLDRTLAAKNFNNYLCESGVFGRHSTDIPQINLINIHGSAYWRKSGEQINVDYALTDTKVVVPTEADELLIELDAILNDSSKTTDDVLAINVQFSSQTERAFWDDYNKLPIVNPTKWKFHETVFEEHYYQMLRLLSYQMEEPNSVLISFAFSFADLHIRNLVRRSLSNPKLIVYVCCYNEKERAVMEEYFSGYRNVLIIALNDQLLDFSKFNEIVFNADQLRNVNT